MSTRGALDCSLTRSHSLPDQVDFPNVNVGVVPLLPGGLPNTNAPPPLLLLLVLDVVVLLVVRVLVLLLLLALAPKAAPPPKLIGTRTSFLSYGRSELWELGPCCKKGRSLSGDRL